MTPLYTNTLRTAPVMTSKPPPDVQSCDTSVQANGHDKENSPPGNSAADEHTTHNLGSLFAFLSS